MSEITESNVEEFKTEHECDEHWELRRKFLLTHSDKFSRDELVCLAQVFTNVEFLGCKYPKETMQLIAQLSHEVVKDYREKQKSRLQRTFVKASDAASSKAKKGQTRQESPKGIVAGRCQPLSNNFRRAQDETETQNETVTQLETVMQNETVTHDKSMRSRSPIRFPETSKAESSKIDFQPSSANNLKRPQEQGNQGRFQSAKKKKKLSNEASEIVLFEYLNDTPQSIVARVANSNNINLDWKYGVAGQNVSCSVFLNRKKMGYAVGPNQKAAKKEASTILLEELRKHYYTIKVTKNLTPTVSGDLGLSAEPQSDAIGSDNIGSKMMKLMGWSGGGLGKKSQGITEPVTVHQQMTREGLGLKAGMYNMGVFKKKCHEVLQNYICGDTSTDLVFSPSFTNEERAVIHQIAQQIGLKSQSYGPKSQRTLTISRKIHPRELVKELLELGGVTEKYELVKPSAYQDY